MMVVKRSGIIIVHLLHTSIIVHTGHNAGGNFLSRILAISSSCTF